MRLALARQLRSWGRQVLFHQAFVGQLEVPLRAKSRPWCWSGNRPVTMEALIWWLTGFGCDRLKAIGLRLEAIASRPLLGHLVQDGLGGFFPATNFIDLGLFEHVGHPGATQRAPVRVDQLPSCSGCLCSVAAINSAGLSGQSLEAPVVWAHDPEREKEIFEGSSSMSEDLKVDGGLRSCLLPPAYLRDSTGCFALHMRVLYLSDLQSCAHYFAQLGYALPGM
eukprot:g516.t1